MIEPSKPEVEVGPTGPREKRPKLPVKRKRRRYPEGDVVAEMLKRIPPRLPDPPDAA